MRDWADGILLAAVVFLIALLSLTVVHTAVGWIRTIRKPMAALRDEVVARDQYREERLARLLQYQPPTCGGGGGRPRLSQSISDVRVALRVFPKARRP